MNIGGMVFLPWQVPGNMHSGSSTSKRRSPRRRASVTSVRQGFPCAPNGLAGRASFLPSCHVEKKTVQRAWDVPRALRLIHSGTFWTRLLGLSLPCPVTGG